MTSRVAVFGQGYVGLPLAMRSVACGFDVVGIDVDTRRVTALKSANSYVEDVPNDELRAALSSGRYTPSASFADAAQFDVALITVPTPLKERLPDLSMIEAAARGLAPHLRRGATVVLESTTYPGTTEELLAPLLESGSGLHVAQDFYLGYSPERLDPGNVTWGLANTPKVVSGVDSASLKVVKAFYDRIIERTVVVSSCRVAEMTKLLENTFRHVNVALVNELAMFAHALDIDVWEAIEAAATKPFGYMRFTPGPGVGGHCLPVDPTYLSWQVKRTLGSSFRFVELANDVNDHMPEYVVSRVGAILNDSRKAVNGSQLLLIGLAYKKNTSDARESPAVRVAQLLVQQGAQVRAVDPNVDLAFVPDGVTLVELSDEELRRADVAILLTDHDNLVSRLSLELDVCVLDTRDRLPRRAGVHRL